MYEKDSVKNENFGKTINVDLMYQIDDMQKKVSNERQTISTDLSHYRKKRAFNKLTSKEKQRVYEMLEQGYASDLSLNIINLQKEFYKSFYIAVSIRLREILRDIQ